MIKSFNHFSYDYRQNYYNRQNLYYNRYFLSLLTIFYHSLLISETTNVLSTPVSASAQYQQRVKLIPEDSAESDENLIDEINNYDGDERKRRFGSLGYYAEDLQIRRKLIERIVKEKLENDGYLGDANTNVNIKPGTLDRPSSGVVEIADYFINNHLQLQQKQQQQQQQQHLPKNLQSFHHRHPRSTKTDNTSSNTENYDRKLLSTEIFKICRRQNSSITDNENNDDRQNLKIIREFCTQLLMFQQQNENNTNQRNDDVLGADDAPSSRRIIKYHQIVRRNAATDQLWQKHHMTPVYKYQSQEPYDHGNPGHLAAIASLIGLGIVIGGLVFIIMFCVFKERMEIEKRRYAKQFCTTRQQPSAYEARYRSGEIFPPVDLIMDRTQSRSGGALELENQQQFATDGVTKPCRPSRMPPKEAKMKTDYVQEYRNPLVKRMIIDIDSEGIVKNVGWVPNKDGDPRMTIAVQNPRKMAAAQNRTIASDSPSTSADEENSGSGGTASVSGKGRTGGKDDQKRHSHPRQHSQRSASRRGHGEVVQQIYVDLDQPPPRFLPFSASRSSSHSFKASKASTSQPPTPPPSDSIQTTSKPSTDPSSLSPSSTTATNAAAHTPETLSPNPSKPQPQQIPPPRPPPPTKIHMTLESMPTSSVTNYLTTDKGANNPSTTATSSILTSTPPPSTAAHYNTGLAGQSAETSTEDLSKPEQDLDGMFHDVDNLDDLLVPPQTHHKGKHAADDSSSSDLMPKRSAERHISYDIPTTWEQIQRDFQRRHRHGGESREIGELEGQHLMNDNIWPPEQNIASIIPKDSMTPSPKGSRNRKEKKHRKKKERKSTPPSSTTSHSRKKAVIPSTTTASKYSNNPLEDSNPPSRLPADQTKSSEWGPKIGFGSPSFGTPPLSDDHLKLSEKEKKTDDESQRAAQKKKEKEKGTRRHGSKHSKKDSKRGD